MQSSYHRAPHRTSTRFLLRSKVMSQRFACIRCRTVPGSRHWGQRSKTTTSSPWLAGVDASSGLVVANFTAAFSSNKQVLVAKIQAVVRSADDLAWIDATGRSYAANVASYNCLPTREEPSSGCVSLVMQEALSRFSWDVEEYRSLQQTGAILKVTGVLLILILLGIAALLFRYFVRGMRSVEKSQWDADQAAKERS